VPQVTFIYPAVGRFPETKYVRSWQMQPLAVAALAALTPETWDRRFFDDRLEPIDFEQATDLVAISTETFTARRSYQIAAEYRKRGVPVVVGGYHPTLCPDEAARHADAVCVGEAEPVWKQIVKDTEAGCLARRYGGESSGQATLSRFDRSIFDGKRYFDIALVETGRGCRFDCTFCAITAFHRGRHAFRPIHEVVAEAAELPQKTVFLVDDNIFADADHARALFEGLRPLRKRWVGQASINVANDPEMLNLMKASGCAGLLIGFESLDDAPLTSVNKHVNRRIDYDQAVRALRAHGLVIYGTFLLGLPSGRVDDAQRFAHFAREQKLFIAAFNHVVPFPGTPLFEELKAKRRLTHPEWWLSEDYRFGDSPFRPTAQSPDALRDQCHSARRSFYSIRSILRRALDFRANCASPGRAGAFLTLNALLRREIDQKRGLPLGEQEGPRTRGSDRRRSVVLSQAGTGDEEELRQLMARMPMPGLVQVAYHRDPNLFEGIKVEGHTNQVIIGRDTESGQVAGMGSRSVKPAYLNGQCSTIGYLSGLRVVERYRGTIHLARAYEQLRMLHRDGLTPLYLSTVVEGNASALAFRGRRGRLPAYHDIGRFRAIAVSLDAIPTRSNHNGLELNPATDSELPRIVEFLNLHGPRRQFFPRYSMDDFARGGLLRGIRPADIMTASRDGALVGVVSAWDQREFRQSVIARYPSWLRVIRPYWNLAAKLARRPGLPAIGTRINGFYLSLVCVAGDDPMVFAHLVNAVMRARKGTNSVMLAGAHERDPLAQTLLDLPHLDFSSRLFVVCWEDGESDLGALDARVPYLEIGAL
jgi:radical SAM superfamily enzyme YgiQ (UPF0313 family)